MKKGKIATMKKNTAKKVKKPGTGMKSSLKPLSKATPAEKKKLNKKLGSPAKMAKKSPMKKPLIGKQANLPKELRDKILASPAKMLKPAALKMMKKSPAKMMKKSAAKMMKKK